LKIAFCTKSDPRDKRSWSGTHFHMLCELQKFSDVEIIGPLNAWLLKPTRYLGRKLEQATGHRISAAHLHTVARNLSSQVSKRISNEKKYDALFFPAGSELIAHLNTNIPIIYQSDATFACMVDYYPQFTNLLNFNRRSGIELERLTLSKCTAAVFSSNWAAGSAIHDFGTAEERVHIVPFGANISDPGKSTLHGMKKNRAKDRVYNFLWVGVDWERKGGEIAYKTVIELRNRGVNARLLVVGLDSKMIGRREHCDAFGFLDKNIPAHANLIRDIYQSADVFLFPSRFECSAIALCEAACFGLPVICFDTGGLANYVIHGVNGYRLPITADASSFCEHSISLLSVKDQLKTFQIAARQLYETELNWNTWGVRMKEVIESSLN
jgi:glycosyltransferase involved in cell wall biosynthesis